MDKNLNYIFDLHTTLSTKNIILVYEGEFTQEITKSVLSMAEKNLETTNEEISIKKKVFNVMVECLQNICKHSEEFGSENDDFNTAIFMIGKEDSEYTITSGNIIYNDRIDGLKNKLDQINSLDKEGLKELFKTVLSSTELSDKGGAGLGFIDMARKSSNKLAYDFYKINDNISFFSLQSRISRNKEV
ncbi:MAG: SiaB family protein kinase [Bacteroidota bacterium]|nr:SiaB family protein kinase [Bacteroidota bacterium]